MKKLSIALLVPILGAAGLAYAQGSGPADAAPTSQPQPSQPSPERTLRRDIEEASGGSGTTGTGASGGAEVRPDSGNPALNSNVRGDPRSSSSSDRATSRNWSGVGSTGGGTGTGTSSGTTDDASSGGTSTNSSSGGETSGSSASGGPADAGQRTHDPAVPRESDKAGDAGR